MDEKHMNKKIFILGSRDNHLRSCYCDNIFHPEKVTAPTNSAATTTFDPLNAAYLVGNA